MFVSAGVASAQSSIQYVYDELGRLIAVIDLNGDAAIYHYDAVGNLLSIDRYTPQQVSVISVSPSKGVVGTTVTVRGTGFSVVTSQNTVMFNGVVANVVSATTTQLVVTVPAGATTGLVGLTTPAGTASSSSPFEVLPDSGAPLIAGFTPTIGVPGTAVTITGNNFEPNVIDNTVVLNLSRASVTSATTSTLTATIPSAMGGHFTVQTALGRTVSSGDFFVPPAPYTAADVVVTDRSTIGGTDDITIGASGKIGLVLFDGVANQAVSVSTLSSTFPTGCSVLAVSVLDPLARTLRTVNSGCSTNTAFLDQVTFPTTGTYTLLFDPSGTNTGFIRLRFNDATDVTNSILPNGADVPASIVTPGQNARYTFTGTAGQVVSSRLTLNVGASCDWTLAILKPDGTTLASTTPCGSSTTVFLDAVSLPLTGTYTVVINPQSTVTGPISVALYTVSDLTGTISADGTAVNGTISTPGQNARYTFIGTAGQVVSSKLTLSVGASCNWTFALLKPDGTTLASTSPCGSSTTVFLDAVALPVTGTYTVLVNPESTVTGSISVALYTVPADVTATTTIGASSVSISITVPGQNAAITFAGTSGQVVTVHVTSNAIGTTTVSLLKPDGSQLTASTSSSVSFNLQSKTLPTTGTYTIKIDPNSANTGSISINVTNP